MTRLTTRIVCELASHEGLCREAYKDSVGVWTWSIGVTNSSGHRVHPRYVDQVQDVRRCLEIYEWLLRTRYLPAVLETFRGHSLTEAQLGGALSFHYNTGRIRTASWPKLWKEGRVAEARASFLSWNRPPEIMGRRRKEHDLFFDGHWSSDGTILEYPVRKPSYQPDFRNGRRIDIKAIMDDILKPALQPA